ncbi:hypothetical protein OKW45_007088 [Paraburkholderia sp. WSM4175]
MLGQAQSLSKIRANDHPPWLSASEALRAGMVGGASALGLGGQLGAIAPGYRADLVAYRTDTISFTPLTDPVCQLVYAERGASIDSVFVAGDAVLRNGRLTRVDEPALLREISAAYEALSAEFDLADESVAPLRAEMERCTRGPDAACGVGTLCGEASSLTCDVAGAGRERKFARSASEFSM